MTKGYDFRLNTSPRASLCRIGSEGERVLVLDNVLANPKALIEYAAEEVTFKQGAGGGYPGVRAPAPLNYVNALVRGISPLLEQAFELSEVRLARAECNFSIVTTPSNELLPSQRVPHYDATDPLQFAFVHYLCSETFGGTAFYRQRSTGFEAITPDRAAEFAEKLRQTTRNSAGYIIGDTPEYEKVGEVEAKFDRLAIYRSRMLHSGVIGPADPLVADPRTGRLTANIFLNYR